MPTFPMQDRFTNTRTLWTFFIASTVLTISFGIVMQVWQFQIIDEIYEPSEVKAHIAALTQTQKMVHAWVTATLDVAYPFAYGGLFIGMSLRFFDRIGFWLALPSALVILVDLAEGVVQVLLLTGGGDDLLAYKQILTPLKLLLLLPGLFATIVGGVLAVRQRRSKP